MPVTGVSDLAGGIVSLCKMSCRVTSKVRKGKRMKQLQVLGVMRGLLVAGMSVEEEDQRGQVPRKNVSAGAIWHEIILRQI
jgi:hypothetical protein